MNPSLGREQSATSPGGWGNLPLPNTSPEDVVTNRTIITNPQNRIIILSHLQNNTLSITQINLKMKRNVWGTLLTNIHGRRNPIILASEPYTNDKNHIPHVHKDLTPYYRKKGTSKPRAAILFHKTNKCCELTQLSDYDH